MVARTSLKGRLFMREQRGEKRLREERESTAHQTSGGVTRDREKENMSPKHLMGAKRKGEDEK